MFSSLPVTDFHNTCYFPFYDICSYLVTAKSMRTAIMTDLLPHFIFLFKNNAWHKQATKEMLGKDDWLGQVINVPHLAGGESHHRNGSIKSALVTCKDRSLVSESMSHRHLGRRSNTVQD